MTSCVLDASAALAVLLKEEGASEVLRHLPAALINTVNLSEVAARLIENGIPMAEARIAIQGLGLIPILFDTDLAWRAAGLRRRAKGLPLSFADRACLATAQREGLIAITSDRTWARLRIGVTIKLIR